MLGLTLLVLLLLSLYFFPMIVAIWHKAENSVSITLINIFLGWTVIGWILAFVLAIKVAGFKGFAKTVIGYFVTLFVALILMALGI